MVGYFYSEDLRYILQLKKYASEAQALAQFNADTSEAVSTDEYEKRVKFPKCFVRNAEKTNDGFDPPTELVKRIPLKSGSSAAVLRPGKYWDDDCKNKVNQNLQETVRWVDGLYIFEVDGTGGNDVHAVGWPFNMQGKSEAFLNDYLLAIGQK